VLSLLVLATVYGQPAWPDSPANPSPAQSLAQLKLRYRSPSTVPHPDDNAPSAARAALGEALFFDPRLSASSDISCATCHDPDRAWGDGRARAVGAGGHVLARRTPTILNLAWSELLFWDGRATSLEAQAVAPLESPLEMNESAETSAARLRQIEGYRRRFEAAYPGEGITPRTIAKAIAVFERTVVSSPSPFDAWIAGDDRAISASAVRGFVLFNTRANCAVCHEGWSLTDGSFYDIGLPPHDRGRGALVPLPSMQFAFKTPTLRDVARRGPYMHDGSLATLADVVEHYDRGGEARSSRSAEVRPLGLSAADKADLVAFLEALTSPPRPARRPELPR
jgi:cytochrome c peroxidase